jgi:flagellar L-ring protein precursor FlgH
MRFHAAFALVALVSCTSPLAFGQQQTANRAQASPANSAQQQQPDTPPKPLNNNDAAVAGQVMQRNGGSLLRATLTAPVDPAQAKIDNVSFFSVPAPEPRVIKKHDQVTIIIREESEFKSEGTTETKKSADLDARIDEFIKLNLANWAIEGGGEGDNPPSIKMSGKRNFKGEGTVDRQDSLTARVTAEVIDVKPNGTLVLQGRKRITTDDEYQQFLITGIARAEDVTADNTVLSTQLADFNLRKTHKGNVRNATKKGFIPKLLDVINPI